MQFEHVPAVSIVYMAASLIVAFGVPTALLIVFKKKFDAKVSSFFIGCVTFVVMALVLEQALHSLVLSSPAGSKITGSIALYALYGGLAAAVFEETGRILAMKFLMKKHLDVSNALMYGAGHGGIEAIILLGLTYINNIVISLMINAGTMPAVFAQLDPALAQATFQQYSGLWTTPSWFFLMSGLERMTAIALHICLSLLIYKGLKTNRKLYIIMAYVFHFAVDAVTVLISSSVPIPVLEAVVLLMVLLIALYVLRVFKLERERD